MLCLVVMRRQQTMPQRFQQRALELIQLPLQLQKFEKMQIQTYRKKSCRQKNNIKKRENKASKEHHTDADTSMEFSIAKSQLIDGNPSASPYEESNASEYEEDKEKGIEINMSPSDAEEYVQKHWYQIVYFGNSQKGTQLKEKVSLTKGDQEAFHIGTDIQEDVNDAIS